MEALRAKYEAAGQAHVFSFYDSLSAAEQRALVKQLESIDPERVNGIVRTALAASASSSAASSSSEEIAPVPDDAVESTLGTGKEQDVARWQATALEAVRDGHVGVLLMAGGQGTRLGSSAPKGCYDISLPSHKSLFQLQAERIRRLASIAGATQTPPWFIMTSGPTRRPTEDFFEQNSYFGLDKSDVIFFEQGVLPCVNNDGKFFMDSRSSVAVAPDGNGGIYAALRAPLSSSDPSRTVLSECAKRGVKYLHAYCVDNCLVRVADPVFMGYCIERQADCAVKVVKKLDPNEAVGVVATRRGRFSVVEYSEIPSELAQARDPATGDLRFRAANIANHFYTLDFLQSVQSFESEMAFHVAHKKIPHVDLTTGENVKPTKPNGIKLELFVFDVFPFTRNMAVLEVARETDFSPLKNAPGTGADDPDTSRRDLLADQRRWLRNAGAIVQDDSVEVEISPLVSYAGEGLESLSGKTISAAGRVEQLSDLDKLA